MAPPSTRVSGPTMEMYGEIVEITVGTGQSSKTFQVHKGIVGHYSGYFDKALNGAFHEARTGKLSLPEEQVAIFQRFVLWLYSGKVEDEEPEGRGFFSLGELWLFADRRDIPLLMNECIDVLKDRCASQWFLPTNVLNLAYENTLAGSPLRLFLVHVVSKTGVSSMIDSQSMLQCDAEPLRDLLKAVWDMDPKDRILPTQLKTMDICQFHQHEEGVSCSKIESTT